ncbi:hypothetical protein C3432_14050 [Citrobacter amalonaticus]|uniref:Uncharacterized protein n=1 Tax=Citrobacter amalonaticus TaxID=35703 RepID=A0A2S4RW55_CITAM|nr:hypothetical protein C3432_14050 [Citrobacter amalonaticus]POT75059.1 hypothetical protein C3436_14520 [Citrobacter amalonaticus]POU64588.1 hypothetical protein C3430_15540 [Citrobacter amalonaticus]POV04424.1 hypothetical protein C3424_14860 [Citrobacter amalonaticus]
MRTIPFVFHTASLLAASTHPCSHTYLCSWGLADLSPQCNLKSIGSIKMANRREKGKGKF